VLRAARSAPSAFIAELKRSAEIMKIRHYILIAFLPIIQIVYGGFMLYWAVPAFPKPAVTKAVEIFIATQPTQLESTRWLVSSSNELKDYNVAYNVLLAIAKSQSNVIFISGVAQLLILVFVAVVIHQKKRQHPSIGV
jgi:hypothetical protein